MDPDQQRERAIEELYYDRPRAHFVLFGQRHKHASPEFHTEIIRDFHDKTLPHYGCIGFRGSAKSTIAEDAIALMGALRQFRNALIIGATLDNARERLHAIRRQFESNAMLIELFGDLKGPRWGDDLIELATGVTISCRGRGQALRGKKGEDVRPDFIVCDDIEERDSVRTPEMREAVQAWFFGELLPAGDANVIVRVLSNDLHPECLANVLRRPGSGWVIKTYPWVIKDQNGNDEAAWPDRFPLDVIDARREQMRSIGRSAEYEAQYMCNSQAPESKPFRREMIVVEARVRTWEAVYTALDPARSVKQQSATTGFIAWSWIGARLMVWGAWAKKLLPDAIVAAVFEENERFTPVWIGVDQVGLSEFLAQPLRHEALRRQVTLPLKPMPAPKSKDERIRALQPFFNAREVTFAAHFQDLEAQLLSYPTGHRDILDAFATALAMRPAAHLYEDFTVSNIGEGLEPASGPDPWLCLNATRSLLTGVLVQALNGTLRIYRDYVREGDPADNVRDMIVMAQLDSGRTPRLVTPAQHFDRFNNVGLLQALRRTLYNVDRGSGFPEGKTVIRDYLRRQTRGFPALMVSTNARWTLNAFSGGYSRALLRGGQLADYAEEGPYRVLMEGLECFAGLLSAGISPDAADDARMNARTREGQRYHRYASSRTVGGIKE